MILNKIFFLPYMSDSLPAIGVMESPFPKEVTITYGIALLNSRGHLTEYGKDLMEEARKSGAHAVIMVDFDLPGIKIASETPTDMPWIGVNDATLEYFHLTRNEVSIPAESNQYKNYVTILVEDGEHPSNAKNDNCGKTDTRFKDSDLEFLKDRRIEIDAILAKVGGGRFFEFIMDRLREISTTRDYNRAIDLSTEYYNKGKVGMLPDPPIDLLDRIQTISDVATAKMKYDIKSKLERVEGFLEIQHKKKEIMTQLKGALVENKDMKVVIARCEELMRPGILPDMKKNDDNDHDDGDESSRRKSQK